MAEWPSDQVTKWSSDRETEWPSDRVTEWQSNRVTKWSSDRVTKWPSDQVTKWPSDQVTKWLSDRVSGSFSDYWPYGIFDLLDVRQAGTYLPCKSATSATCLWRTGRRLRRAMSGSQVRLVAEYINVWDDAGAGGGRGVVLYFSLVTVHFPINRIKQNKQLCWYLFVSFCQLLLF